MWVSSLSTEKCKRVSIQTISWAFHHNKTILLGKAFTKCPHSLKHHCRRSIWCEYTEYLKILMGFCQTRNTLCVDSAASEEKSSGSIQGPVNNMWQPVSTATDMHATKRKCWKLCFLLHSFQRPYSKNKLFKM
jgi:hypothetical protein